MTVIPSAARDLAGRTGTRGQDSRAGRRSRPTEGSAVIVLKSTGPLEITYINPADDPRKAAVE